MTISSDKIISAVALLFYLCEVSVLLCIVLLGDAKCEVCQNNPIVLGKDHDSCPTTKYLLSDKSRCRTNVQIGDICPNSDYICKGMYVFRARISGLHSPYHRIMCTM